MPLSVVVFSGAGISADSGIKTFRDSEGLWENYSIEEVATPQAWQADFTKVLDFYNQRRKQIRAAKPNAAHYALAGLSRHSAVTVITQNIDDLHERAGSDVVLHLHGEITKARSTRNDSLIYTIEGDTLLPGERCELGSQLRPHIVWFGEEVPAIPEAIDHIRRADIVLVIGTSLQVYPAAGLINYVRHDAQAFYIDPLAETINLPANFRPVQGSAAEQVPQCCDYLINTYLNG